MNIPEEREDKAVNEEEKLATSRTDEISSKLEEMDEDELEKIKVRLQEIRKQKAEATLEKKTFTHDELLWRFEYFIMQKQAEVRRSIAGYALVVAIFVGFIVVLAITGEQSMWYGIGFATVFFAGLTAYMFISAKEIKALKDGMKEPEKNIGLVVKDKTWYEMEYDKLTDEEKEERRKRNARFNIFTRFSKK